jgi:hypothetical protein
MTFFSLYAPPHVPREWKSHPFLLLHDSLYGLIKDIPSLQISRHAGYHLDRPQAFQNWYVPNYTQNNLLTLLFLQSLLSLKALVSSYRHLDLSVDNLNFFFSLIFHNLLVIKLC